MTDGRLIVRVPRDESSRLELLSVRPPAWEYLLFGYALHSGLARTEPKWRDYHLGYSMQVGPAIPMSDLGPVLEDRASQAGSIASNITKVISQKAQETAFGLPGESGDSDLIEHMGGRLILLYEQLLDWAQEVRSFRVESKAERLPELMAALVAQPITETRSFVQSFIEQVEAAVAAMAAGAEEPMNVSMYLTFDVTDDVAYKAYRKEWKRVFGRLW